MKHLFHSVAFLSLIMPWTPAVAANAANGRELAVRWCASCHVISSNQTQASSDAPPFTEVAKGPGFDAARLALFLLDPHPKMPNMSLTRNEAADLAAFIKTLGPSR